ncbi:MAG: hypothetical protein ACON4R_13660 [Akkermansiaceae bacterium]
MGEVKIRHGAKSFLHRSDLVSVIVTESGGHLTAEFDLGGRRVSPYALGQMEYRWIPLRRD